MFGSQRAMKSYQSQSFELNLNTHDFRGMAGSANQEDLLFFYGRYKQATVGPCDAPKPSFFQMKEKSKWNAWNELGNKSRKMT